MPASLKLQQEFGEDLQVLFVESQGATPDEAASFVLKQRWLGGRSMWTSEAPCSTGMGTLPSAVLLSSEGKVLYKGNPLDAHKEIVRLISEDVKAQRDPPADSPKPLKAAWSAFGKGKLAEALKLVDQIPEKDRAALGDAWAETRAEIVAWTTRAVDRARRNLDQGYPDECADQLEKLSKACEGQAELKKPVDELKARLASKEGSAEREAAKVVGRLEAKYFESGGEEAARKDLERVAAKFAGTKVAARAQASLAIGPKK